MRFSHREPETIFFALLSSAPQWSPDELEREETVGWGEAGGEGVMDFSLTQQPGVF